MLNVVKEQQTNHKLCQHWINPKDLFKSERDSLTVFSVYILVSIKWCDAALIYSMGYITSALIDKLSPHLPLSDRHLYPRLLCVLKAVVIVFQKDKCSVLVNTGTEQ